MSTSNAFTMAGLDPATQPPRVRAANNIPLPLRERAARPHLRLSKCALARRVRGEFFFAAFALSVLGATTASAADAPKFGKPITEADAASWDISIGPDGKGLPAGSGTPAQGKAIYAQKCAACHGATGEGSASGPRLFGGIGTLKAPAQPVQTVGSYWPYPTMVFDFVRRAMPWDKPKSLSNDEVYASVAYVFQLNGLMKDGDVLNKDTLMKIQMPNRDGFINLYPNKF